MKTKTFTELVSVRLEKPDLESLQKIAALEERTIGQVVRSMVLRALRRTSKVTK
jgi:predicted DNA-binding ribbon-helix-helix protein